MPIHEIMKQKIYLLGVITVLIVFTGLVFKINHLAGAGILLITGIAALLLLFLPLALFSHYKAEGNRQNPILHVVTWLTCFVVFTSMLFKIMHWPFAGILITVALPFPYVIFLPVFLITTSRNKNFNINSIVFVLLLLALSSVFSALLALNVSRDRINDSFDLSRNYDKLGKTLNQIADRVPESSLVIKIDEVLKTVNEYQDIILKQENMTVEQWKNDPENLIRPDSKGIAAQALVKNGDSPAGTKLLNSLKNLVKTIEATSGNNELAKAAPVILDLEVPSGNESEWGNRKFRDNNLSWVLIYLDGLETNLKMIKATL